MRRKERNRTEMETKTGSQKRKKMCYGKARKRNEKKMRK